MCFNLKLLPVKTQIQSLLHDLEKTPGGISKTDGSPFAEVRAVETQYHDIDKELNDSISKLENNAQMLDDIKIEIDCLSTSQADIKQALNQDVPLRQKELEVELNKLQVSVFLCCFSSHVHTLAEVCFSSVCQFICQQLYSTNFESY